MKYFIYWFFYSSTLGGGDIAGVVEVTDTTVRSYIYGEGYFTWNIVEKDEHRNEKYHLIDKAEYHLEAHGVRSVMLVSHKEIIQHISTEPPVTIVMKLK